MNKNYTRKRKRTNQKIDAKLRDTLCSLSKDIDFPKSRIIEEGVAYVLKHKKAPSLNYIGIKERQAIDFTINDKFWTLLKEYAKVNNYKIVDLLELGLKYSLKKYQKIKEINTQRIDNY